MVLSCPTVSVVSAEFREAVACALSYVGRQDLTRRPKQEEGLVHLYDGRDVFA